MVFDWLVGIDQLYEQMCYFKAGEDNDITVSIDNFNEFSHWILQVENFSEFPMASHIGNVNWKSSKSSKSKRMLSSGCIVSI